MLLLQLQLDECTEALEAASRLSEQLDKKEEMVAALREEGWYFQRVGRQWLLVSSEVVLINERSLGMH